MLVVRGEAGPPPASFDLRSAGDDARVEANRICDDEIDRGIDLRHGPLARLTVIEVEEGCIWLCMTHHHLGLDGVGLRTAMEDLVRLCVGLDLRQTAQLDEVLRAWLELDAVQVVNGASPGLQLGNGDRLSTFAPEKSTRDPRTRTLKVAVNTLEAVAVEAGTSPAALVIAAWACALRTIRPSDLTPVSLSVDRREAPITGHGPTVGMFADTVLALEIVVAGDSPVVVAERLAERVAPPVQLPHLSVGTEHARRSGAVGTPDTLITVYSEASQTSAFAGVDMRLVRAAEQNEFAVDVTAQLTVGAVTVEFQYDGHRVAEHLLDRLAWALERFLVDPHTPASLEVLAPATAQMGSATGDDLLPSVARVVANVTRGVVGTAPGVDDDLYAAGVDSLTFLQIAVALRRLGHDVGVGALIEAGSIRAMARHLVKERGHQLVGVSGASDQRPSPVEAGYLRLTSSQALGPAPMHEQSVLTFHGRLDPSRLVDAFDSCLAQLPSLARVWHADGSLAAPTGQAHSFDVIKGRATRASSSTLRDVVEHDLTRTFGPGAGSLMRMVAVLSDGETSLVLSFHQAVLDGWSFATFVRALQRRYVDPRSRLDAEDSTRYRQWALSGDHDVSGLTRHVHGLTAAPARSDTTALSRARGSSRVQLDSTLVHEAALRIGTSESACLTSAIGIGLRRALHWPDTHPLGLRSTVRDGTGRAGVRTVGQLTVDIPFPRHESSLAAGAAAARTTYAALHRHGHLGQEAIDRELGSANGDAPALDTVLVVENYFTGDERDLREFDQTAWKEKTSWRRDTSASPRTVTVERGSVGWALEVHTILDPAPALLATSIATEAVALMKAVVQWL
ncbi:Phosphopantetheine attachment site [Tessaracoccus bendigoensis DSM 12906]|uniref:Phosphopantetheine attachment site n=2 Tax=Tessaracoccus TaxID=72763 RepID=A0A1M6LMK4_9ACTN|nr:Phosphopantetheine attachment site [Tessaracoccus bendigoensis DSM 12906]